MTVSEWGFRRVGRQVSDSVVGSRGGHPPHRFRCLSDERVWGQKKHTHPTVSAVLRKAGKGPEIELRGKIDVTKWIAEDEKTVGIVGRSVVL